MAGGRSGTNSYMKDGRKDGRVTDQEKGAAETTPPPRRPGGNERRTTLAGPSISSDESAKNGGHSL